jgi:hypothetical protein
MTGGFLYVIAFGPAALASTGETVCPVATPGDRSSPAFGRPQ